MLLIFATRYDDSTERSHSIAIRLIEKTETSKFQYVPLLSDDATQESLRGALNDKYEVVAFYSHGDDNGTILAQNRLACIDIKEKPGFAIPSFSKAMLYAYACRAFLWLSQHKSSLNTGKIFGYSEDIIIPNSDNPEFWKHYEHIHSYIPLQLMHGRGHDDIKRDFFQECTDIFDSLSDNEGGLMELMAVQQARDGLEIGGV